MNSFLYILLLFVIFRKKYTCLADYLSWEWPIFCFMFSYSFVILDRFGLFRTNQNVLMSNLFLLIKKKLKEYTLNRFCTPTLNFWVHRSSQQFTKILSFLNFCRHSSALQSLKYENGIKVLFVQDYWLVLAINIINLR